MSRIRKGLTDEEIAVLLAVEDPNISKFELSGVENELEIAVRSQTPVADESSSKSDDNGVPLSDRQHRGTKWRYTTEFNPEVSEFAAPEILTVKSTFEYFTQYIDRTLFDDLAYYINLCHVTLTGKSMDCSGAELRKFWGVSMQITSLGFPRLRMCWGRRTRYPLIADTISSDRFYLKRYNLKLVNDNAVSEKTK
ncbi:uncharacterized protein LOC126188312 [Schistocerca cancellata]|uniref:uncharacterized protein LOC126188312 n=1 Tax=Schistocerca cancellata TaxID=274614 RepID=UPI0021177D33|nr:uncharacterized protein LOC126188312 [Schistocerca cancellata]